MSTHAYTQARPFTNQSDVGDATINSYDASNQFGCFRVFAPKLAKNVNMVSQWGLWYMLIKNEKNMKQHVSVFSFFFLFGPGRSWGPHVWVPHKEELVLLDNVSYMY